MTILQARLKKLSSLSDKALLGTDGKFYVFGEGICECLYADGHMSRKIKKEEVVRIKYDEYFLDDPVNTKANRIALIDKAAKIYQIVDDDLLAEFSLNDVKRRALAKRIKEEDATHFQIECNGKEIRAYCFDVRSTIGSSKLRVEELLGANGLYLKVGKRPFKFSVDATAWGKLPKEGCSVKIYSNGIMRLEYHNDGIRVSIRDQEIRRPHMAFYSERMKKRVLFLFHPKKGSLVKENSDISIQQ